MTADPVLAWSLEIAYRADGTRAVVELAALTVRERRARRAEVEAILAELGPGLVTDLGLILDGCYRRRRRTGRIR